MRTSAHDSRPIREGRRRWRLRISASTLVPERRGHQSRQQAGTTAIDFGFRGEPCARVRHALAGRGGWCRRWRRERRFAVIGGVAKRAAHAVAIVGLAVDYDSVYADLAATPPQIVTDALAMAWFRSRPPPGSIHYSDRGSQYATKVHRGKPDEDAMRCSMSRKANCWDNAPAESFFNSLKNERVHGARYPTREQAVADLYEYIEVFYNRSRRRSTLGYQSPIRLLPHWITTQPERTMAA